MIYQRIVKNDEYLDINSERFQFIPESFKVKIIFHIIGEGI